MEVFLLANSSNDNTRVADRGRDGFLWFLDLREDKLYFYLLTSGTDEHLVCQALPAYGSMLNPNVGDYKGWTGLSPPVAYPSIREYKGNEGSL